MPKPVLMEVSFLIAMMTFVIFHDFKDVFIIEVKAAANFGIGQYAVNAEGEQGGDRYA